MKWLILLSSLNFLLMIGNIIANNSVMSAISGMGLGFSLGGIMWLTMFKKSRK